MMARNTERHTITLTYDDLKKLERIPGNNRSAKVRRAIGAYSPGKRPFELAPAYEDVLKKMVEAGYGSRDELIKRAAYKGLRALKDEVEKELPRKKK